VGQVPAICSEDQLNAIFGQFGDILEIQIMRDKVTNRSKGSAWVTFRESSAADDAIETLHGKHSIPPQSNALQIRYAKGSGEGGGGGGSGGGGGGAASSPPGTQHAPGFRPGAPSFMPGQVAAGSTPGWDGTQQVGGEGHQSPPAAQAMSQPGMQGNFFGFPYPGGPQMLPPQQQPQQQQQQGGQERSPQRHGDPRQSTAPFPSRGGRKLFVGQLPRDMTQEQVRSLMTPYGTIEELHVMTDKRTGQGTGAAFVIYYTREEAQAAIQALNGEHTVEGMRTPLQVRFAEGEIDREKEAKLFVGQVPFSASEEDLRAIFEQFGSIVEVALVRQKDRSSKGCGFVRFQDRQGADKAIQALHGRHTMQGGHSPLTVRFADSEQEKRKRRDQRHNQNMNTINSMMTGMNLQSFQGMPMPMPLNPMLAPGMMPMMPWVPGVYPPPTLPHDVG